MVTGEWTRITCTWAGSHRCWRPQPHELGCSCCSAIPSNASSPGWRTRGHRGALTAEAYSDALVRGFYGQALAEWTRHFPREQMLVLQYERCVQDPVGEIQRTYRFLNLPPFAPDEVTESVNRRRAQLTLPNDPRRRLRGLYRPDVLALAAATPEIDPELWPNFARLVTSCSR